MLCLLVSLILAWSDDGQPGLPDLEHIFVENRSADFSRLLPSETSIEIQLEPLLFDHGHLNRDQVLMAFDKLQSRFVLIEARTASRQSDTNYAWLEVYLAVVLRDTWSDLVYRATFAFHFKKTESRVAISRWVLQDVH